MKDEKNYNGWNNGYEQKQFKIQLAIQIEKWKESGMNDQQIKEMVEFEKTLFKSRRRYYDHNLLILDEVVHQFPTYTPEHFPINTFEDLQQQVTDQRLHKAFIQYPAFKDVGVLLAQGYDVQSIAKILNKSTNAIHIILFKVRKISKD